MPESQAREIELLGTTLEYRVNESSDASEPRIDVDIHGIQVITPADADVEPSSVLKENAAWVVEKVKKYEYHRDQIPERRFAPGETFPYLGHPHQIVVERRSSSVVSDGEFRLAEHHVEETSIERALETLYRRKAPETFEERAEDYAEGMGVEYEQIEVRNQRTKWGSCSTTGTLGLNWRLMMAPLDVVEYIIIHELAHLRESNHTDAFWSLVAEYDPDYQDHVRWLEEHSVRLIFSEEDL